MAEIDDAIAEATRMQNWFRVDQLKAEKAQMGAVAPTVSAAPEGGDQPAPAAPVQSPEQVTDGH